MCVCVCVHSVAQLYLTLCDPLDCYLPGSSVSLEFFRQEYWCRLPFPTPGDLCDPGIMLASLVSPALAGRFLTTAPPIIQQCIVDTVGSVMILRNVDFLFGWLVGFQAVNLTESNTELQWVAAETFLHIFQLYWAVWNLSLVCRIYLLARHFSKVI